MLKHPQVSFKGVQPSPALLADIEQKIEQLEHFAPAMTSCRVVVEVPHRRHAQGDHYHVIIHAAVPGRELVVDRNHDDARAHEDAYVAVRDAFAAMRRQLQDAIREQRPA